MREKFYRHCLLIHALAWLPFMGQHFWEINLGVFATLALGRFMHVRGKPLPYWAGGIIIVTALALLYNRYETLKGLETAVGLLAFLGALKTAEIVKKRDLLAQLLMSELLLTGHLLSTDSLAAVLYLLAVNFLIFWVLMAFQGNEEGERWSSKALRFYVKVFAFSLVLAVGFFFIFPRLPISKFFARVDAPVSQMGFGDEIKPGDFTRIVKDPTPIFRASFNSVIPISYENMYWKGATLSRIEGFSWKREKQGARTQWEEVASAEEYSYEVDFSVLREDFLFLLDKTTSFKKLSPGKIVDKGGGTYRFYPRLNKKMRYRGAVSKASWRDISVKERKRYLSLPEKASPKVTAYVEGITSQFSGTEERVRAVVGNFEKGNFLFTLSPGALSGDYLEDFLFRSKKGYCEHFASATGILLRMMGIPTRLVVGFHGGLWNPLGKYFILRNQDAHAWIEFWKEEEGWERLDPTKYVFPERISRGFDVFEEGIEADREGTARNDWLVRWKTLWFAVDMAYYRLGRSFFALDYETQKQTLARWGVVDKVPLKMILVMVGLFGICGLAFFVVMRRRGRKIGMLERYYDVLCRKMARAGDSRKKGQGPRDYSLSFEHTVEDFEAVKSAFDDYILIKYGGQKDLTGAFVRKVKGLRPKGSQ